MTQTITIYDIDNNIASEMQLHDSLIGNLLEKANLPEDGSVKEKEYDAPMIDILIQLIEDIQDRLENFDTYLDMNSTKFDEHAKEWWSAWNDMHEALHEELDKVDENGELSKREYCEVIYQIYYGSMEAGYDGSKMIAMSASLSLGEYKEVLL